MFRRWFALALMAWATLSTVIGYAITPTTVLAATESYAYNGNANDPGINATGTLNATFILITNTQYTYDSSGNCPAHYTLSLNTAGASSGVISTTSTNGNCTPNPNLSGNVAITGTAAGGGGAGGGTAGKDTYAFNANGNIAGTGAVNGTFTTKNNLNWDYITTKNGCTVDYDISTVTTNGNNSNGQIVTTWNPNKASCAPATSLNGTITISGQKSGANGAATGTYNLAQDAQSITASGSYPTCLGAGNNGNGANPVFNYSSADQQYEFTVPANPADPQTQDVTATITNVSKIGSTTNYTGTLTIPAPCNFTGNITINATANTAAVPNTSGAGSNAPPCNAGDLSWLICSIINLLVNGIDALVSSILIPFIQVQPLSTTATITNADGTTSVVASPTYSIWGKFRDLASVFFILIFFIIIFGTAIGMDNYTVKKILPRLVAGAILVPLSWYICAVGIDIGNVLGFGLLKLCQAVIPNPTIDIGTPLAQIFFGIGGAIVVTLATVAITTIGLGVLLTIAFAVLAAILTLVLRKILIILFVVLSPFALLAWILPNTEKLYKQWWTTLTRLILMFPLIMLLIEAGRIFSLTAGSALAGGNIALFGVHLRLAAAPGTGALQQSAVPFLQLTGLFLPLGAVPWTFKWAGGAMAFGAGMIARGRKAADSRFGRSSDFAKGRAEERRRKAVINANDPNINGVRRAFNRARSETGGGFAGMGRGNRIQQAAAQDAFAKATKTTATADAGRRARDGALPGETPQQRIQAETQAALTGIADERAGRQGIRNNVAAGAVSGRPTDLAAAGNAIAGQRYLAGVQTATLGEAKRIGTDRAVIRGAQVRPIAPQVMQEHAQYVEEGNQAQLRGEMLGSVSTVRQIDQRNVATGRAANRNEAADLRVRDQSLASYDKAREDVAGLYGAALARNAVTQAGGGRESVADLTDAGMLAEREKQAHAKAERQERVSIRNTPGYAETADEVLEAETEHARESLGKAANTRRAAREVGRRTGETTEQFLANDYGTTERATFDAANKRIQTGQASREDADENYRKTMGPTAYRAAMGIPAGAPLNPAQEAAALAMTAEDIYRANNGMLPGTPLTPAQQAAAQAAVAGNYDNMQMAASREAARRTANADVGKSLSVLNDEAGSNLPGGTTSQQYRQQSNYEETKKLGTASGNVQGVLEAQAEEAARDNAAPGSFNALAEAGLRSSRAGRINSSTKAAEAFGTEQGTINANATRTVTAAQAAGQAERATEQKASADNATSQEKLAESQIAEEQLARQLFGVAPGVAVTPVQLAAARAQMRENSARKAGAEARDTQASELAGTAAAVRGREQAIDREIRREADATGRVLTTPEAERNIVNNAAAVAAEKAEKEAAGKASADTGTLGERENALNDEIARVYNETGAYLTRDQAEQRLANAAAEKSRLDAVTAERKTVAEEFAAQEGHQQAVDEEIARAAAAGAPIPAGATQRAQAARNISRNIREDVRHEGTRSQLTAASGARGKGEERERAVQKQIDDAAAAAAAGTGVAIDRATAQRNLIHNASEQGRIEAADSERKKIGDAEGVAGSEATEADDEIDHMGREEVRTELARAGLANTLENRRRVALERVRRRGVSASSRLAGNKRTGQAAEERGIIENRDQWIQREIDEGRVPTTILDPASGLRRATNAAEKQAAAIRNLERRAATAATKKAGDNYNKGNAEELGITQGYDAALKEQAGNNRPTSAQLRAARLALADQEIKKTARETRENLSSSVGQTREENIAADADAAAIEADLKAQAAADAAAARAAGFAGARARRVTRQQVQSEMLRRQRLAGAETGARAQATKSGRTEALVQAARVATPAVPATTTTPAVPTGAPGSGRPTAEQRRDSAVREQIKVAANESASVTAHDNPAVPKIAPTQQFADSLRNRQERENEKVIDDAMTDAAAGLRIDVPGRGRIPLKDVQYSKEEMDAVQKILDDAFTTGDIPTALAAMDHLASGSASAQARLVDRSDPNSVVRRWFGGGDDSNVSSDPKVSELARLHPELVDQMQTLWNRAVKGGKDPDLKLPPSVSMDKIGADQLLAGGDRWKGRLIGRATDKARDKNKEKHEDQIANGIATIFNNPTKAGNVRNPDRDALWRFVLRRDANGVLLDDRGNRIKRIDPKTGNDVVDSRYGDAFLREYRPGEMSAEADASFDAAKAAKDKTYADQFRQYQLILGQQNGADIIKWLEDGHKAERTKGKP